MSVIFPSEEWLKGLEIKLNSDEKYRELAKNWEGDLFFNIEPGGNLKEPLTFYLDLWHGACRKVEYISLMHLPTQARPSSCRHLMKTLRLCCWEN